MLEVNDGFFVVLVNALATSITELLTALLIGIHLSLQMPHSLEPLHKQFLSSTQMLELFGNSSRERLFCKTLK